MTRRDRGHEGPAAATRRVDRAALSRTTALQAACLVVLTAPAHAGPPSPSAQPSGGTVVAGAATINQTANATVITQSSQRGVVDWQGFNVGSQQSVTFAQPSASASTLNRVVGPDPSAIAGKISANGQVVISNPAGVIFFKGAQVDTAGLVATSANITNPNFMSGRMVFDGAGKPGARVVNRGTITARDAGLVGLVAPRVENSGVIDAKLGHVVIAGASTATLDMYGDGLLSIDVTKQVVQAPTGRDGKAATALVTNTGTILANGGSVRITAAAADGIVSNLVDAGGTISAGGGTIAIMGTGGSVRVNGSLLANGRGPAGAGGAIAVNAPGGTVTLAKGAQVSANGAAGGGTIAIGTTLARAAGGPAVASTQTAKQVAVAPGATISANAMKSGNGGNVVLLSTGGTSHAGAISARGGKISGNGGTVEISGATIGLTGGVDVSATHGAPGAILLDPVNIVIAYGTGDVTPGTTFDPNPNDTAATGTISTTAITALNGNVHIEATNNLAVNSPFTMSSATNLTLEAGNGISFAAAAGVSVPNGSLTVLAASPNSPGYTASGIITQAGTANLSASGNMTLSAQGGITLNASVTVGNGNTLALLGDTMNLAGSTLYAPGGTVIFSPVTANRPIELIASGSATANTLSLDAITLQNVIGNSGAVPNAIFLGAPPATPGATPVAGGIKLGNAGDSIAMAQITGAFTSGTPPTLGLYTQGTVTQGGSLSTGFLQGQAAAMALTAPTTVVSGGTLGNQVGTLEAISTTGDFSLTNAQAIAVSGTLNGGNVTLLAPTNSTVFESSGGVISATTLNAAGYEINLANANAIGALGTITAAAVVSVTNAQSLTVAGPVTVTSGSVALTATTGDITLGASSASVVNGGMALDAAAGAITQSPSGTISASTLRASAKSISLPGAANNIPLIDGATATAGNVLIVDTASVSLYGTIQVPSAGTVTVQADQFHIPQQEGPSGSIVAPSGLVILEPLTAGRPVELIGASDTANASALSINTITTGFITASTLQLGSATTGAISIGNTGDTLNLSANVQTLDLISAGSITESGLLTVNTVTGSAVSVSLDRAAASTGATNTIAVLGAFTATSGDFALSNTGTLLTIGPVSASGSVAISTTGALSLAGNITASATPAATYSIYLTSQNAGISQSAGTITAPSLQLVGSGSVAQTTTAAVLNIAGIVNVAAGGTPGNALLTTPTNSIGAIGGLPGTASAAVGTLSVASVTAMNVGTITAPSVTLSAPGLTLTGIVSATSLLDLVATGGTVIQTGGDVVVPGTASLSGSFNTARINIAAVAALGTITANQLTLVNIGALAINGPITPANASAATGYAISAAGPITVAGTIAGSTVSTSSINLTATSVSNPNFVGNITQNSGLISAPFVTLTAAGTISQSGGVISDALSGSAGGSATFIGNSNTVSALAGFSSHGGLTLDDATTVTIGGPVTDTTFVVVITTGAASNIVLTGSLAAPSIYLSAGGGITQSGGAITGPSGVTTGVTLTALATTGAVSLPSASNAFNALFGGSGTSFSVTDSTAVTVADSIQAGRGSFITITDDTTNFAAGGTLSVSNGTVTLQPLSATSLSVGGSNPIGATPPVSASELILGSPTTTTLTVAGALAPNVGTLALVSGGPIVGGAGAITVGTLSASGATIALTGANTITTLGAVNSISAGGVITAATSFALTDNGDLSLTGPIAAGVATLTSPAGAISEVGPIAVATLNASANALTLNGANAIGALGAITTSGALIVTDSGNLSIAGTVKAGNATFSDTGGTISESSGGVLSVGTLIASAAGLLLTGAANTIATLGAITVPAPGTVAIIDASSLTVAGTLDPGNVTLSTLGGLAITQPITAINATITAAGTVGVPGAVTETGAGALNVTGTLTGSADSVALTQTNSIATLGAFTSIGGFSLQNAIPLTLAGPVTDATGVSLAVTGALTLAGTLAAPTVTMTASGAITQTAGVISVPGTLNATGGGIALTQGNSIGTLGLVTGTGLSGNITISDAVPLTIAGVVSAGGTASLLVINDNSPTIAATGVLNAVGATATLQPYTAGGTLTVGGGGGLAGAVLVNANTLVLGSASAGALAITGALNLNGVATLDLLSGGAITESGTGALLADTVIGGAYGAVALGGANQIVSLGAMSAGGNLVIRDASAVAIVGALSAPGQQAQLLADSVTFDSGGVLNVGTTSGTIASGAPIAVFLSPYQAGDTMTLSGGSGTGATVAVAPQAILGSYESSATGSLIAPGALRINGGLNFGAAAVSVGAAGLVTETPGGESSTGAVAAGTLTATAGTVSLTGANAVATLGTATSTGGFALTNIAPLVVSGPITDQTAIALNVTGSLGLAGNLTAPAIGLTANGTAAPIGQTGGIVTATTLTTSSTGATTLGQPNAIGTIAAGTAAGLYAVADVIPLTVASGTITAGTIILRSNTLTLASGAALLAGQSGLVELLPYATAGALAVTGNGALATSVATAGTVVIGGSGVASVTLAGNLGFGGAATLDLLSAGTITEAAGAAFNAQTLIGAVGGATLGGANTLAALGAFRASGGIGLATGTPLTINGPVTAGSLSLSVTGSITAPGAISTGTLSAGATGTGNFSGANTISALGSVATVGGLSLADNGTLSVIGPVTDATSIGITTTSSLALAGALSGGAVSLAAGGAITQSGGGLVANSLTASAGGGIALGQGNGIVTLGNVTAGGNILIGNAASLAIGGTVTAGQGGTLTIAADQIGFTTGGSLTASGGTVALAPFAAGDTLAVGGIPFSASTLLIGTASAGAVTLAGTLNAGGATVDLLAAGAISQSGGALIAGTLGGNAGGAISLTGANQISTLGAIIGAGSIQVSDVVPVTIAGTVSAPGGQIILRADSMTFASGALLNVGSTAVAGAGVTLAPYQSGDNLTIAGSPAVVAPTLTLGSYTSTGTPVSAGTLLVTGIMNAGASVVGLNATTLVAETGAGAIDADSLSATAGQVTLTGQNIIGALGIVTTRNGFSFADVAQLRVAGPLSDATAINIAATGPLALAGNLAAPNVTLTTTGTISQSGGTIGAGTLTASADGITLTNANSIATLGGLTAANAINITDGIAVTVAGPVSTGTLTITTPGGINFTGTTTATTANLFAGGQITQTSGSFSAGTLAGTAAGLAQLGPDDPGPSASVGTLNGFTVGNNGTFSLSDSQALTIEGTLTAAQLAISAPGAIVLNGGNIITTGLPTTQQNGSAPVRPGSYLLVTAGAQGGGAFTQTGTSTVAGPAGGAATLRIQVPDGGSAQFADLNAPNLNLVLGTSTNGTATGHVTLANLLVIGQGGAATLSGTVANQTGFGAAAASFISPAVSTRYTLNDCPIQSASCTVVTQNITPPSPIIPPPAPPPRNISELTPKSFLPAAVTISLPILTLSIAPDPTDPDLMLPNVANEDDEGSVDGTDQKDKNKK